MASLRHGFEEPGDVQDIRLVVDTIPTLAWSAGPDGSAEFFNQRWLDYTGLSAKQALDSAWQVAIHPDDLPRILETFRDALNSVRPYEVEGRFRRFDGEFRWFLFRGSPLRDRSGKVAKWYGTNTDLEERKRAEDALRESEAYLLEAQRMSHTGSWKHDTASGRVIVSPEVYRIYGVKPDEVQSNTELVGERPLQVFWLNRTHPEDAKRIQELYAKSEIQKTGYETDYRIVLHDGVVKHLHVTGHPIVNEKGDLVEFVGTVMDLTAAKQAEEKLRRSEADLLEGQRLTHTLTWRYDVSSRKVTQTPEANRIYGFKGDEDTSDPELYFEMIHPDDRKRVRELFERCTVLRINYEADYAIILPDRNIRHIHATGHPVVNESGDLVEWTGTTMDVTEQVQARIDLEKALEEIKRLRDQLHNENVVLREQIDQAFMFEEIVGTSSGLQGVLSRLMKVAPTDSSVLVSGETGTGKELIARAIHKRSRRSQRAFVSVNCAALAPSLISSELFGHEKGAFTGAMQRRLGRFELANGGTIFLDEIGEVPLDTQIALLRVLQEREFERVGGTQPVKTDVRIIAATNRDLEAAVANGTFRPDLYYRLNVFPIQVPPLRERQDDVLMLLEYFVHRFAQKMGKHFTKIDKRTVELFRSYPWPGNIRELQNVVERSVIVSSDGVFCVDAAWLSRDSRRVSLPPQPEPVDADEDASRERQIIEGALAESRGRVSGPDGAAARLRLPASTLEHRIKKLRIRKSHFKLS